MSTFSRYRPFNYKFYTPERFTADEARERRLAAVLEREQRFQTLWQAAPLSPGFKIYEKMPEANEDRKRYGPKAASIAAALSQFKESDFADPLKRKQYRALRSAQEVQRKVSPSGADKRQFNPTGKGFASTIYGTTARLASRLVPLHGMSWKPVFESPTKVVPCVQRVERREVMFAKHHAGRGYHTRKRRSWASAIPC